MNQLRFIAPLAAAIAAVSIAATGCNTTQSNPNPAATSTPLVVPSPSTSP